MEQISETNPDETDVMSGETAAETELPEEPQALQEDGAAEAQQTETQQTETQQTETQQTETQQTETQQTETQQAEAQQTEAQQAETQQTEAQQTETQEPETRNEVDQEEETETEEAEEIYYSVGFEAKEGFSFVMEDEQVSYRAGEKVSFEVVTDQDCLLDSVNGYQTSFSEGGQEAEDPLRLGETVRMTQTTSRSDSGDEDTDAFIFTMPEADVLLTANVMKASPETVEVRLDNHGIKSVPKAWVTEGKTWEEGSKDIGYTRYRKVVMPDGKERICYCLEPPKSSDPEGEYTATELTIAKQGKISKAEAELLRKALFYCYGGPGWKTGDVLALLDDCSRKDEYYVACHFILSKIYTDAVGGEWNKVNPYGTEFTAMNDTGVKVIKAAVALIKTLPTPTAELSTSQVSAAYNDAAGYAQTQTVTYTSTVDDNVLTVTLPDKVRLVTNSAEFGPGEEAVIKPGETFYLKKNGYGAAHSETLTFKAAMFTDFEAYLINTSKDKQNMGFSIAAENTFTLQISWPDLLTKINIVKKDACTGSSTPSANYRLDGAKYGIYADSGKTKLLEELTISQGKAVSSEKYMIGTTYYVAEISAMPEYRIDQKVYPIVAAAGAKAVVTSADTPKAFKISVQKKDKETGKTTPQTKALPFSGAVFGVFSDSGCTTVAKDMNGKAVPNLVTDQNGSASTAQNLLIGKYWVKELKAPQGYLASSEVFSVDINTTKDEILNQDSTVKMTFSEQIIRGNVELMKVKSVKGDLSPAAGIRFRFTYVKDPTVKFRVGKSGEDNLIVTDADGYASTVSGSYPGGTLLYGEWRIEEENTPAGCDPIEPMTVMVNSNGRIYRFTATNKSIQAAVMIEKRDANTGELIPAAGVAFSIYKDGDQIYLFDPASRSLSGSWVTDADGCVQLPDTLEIGTYSIREDPKTLPEGYYVMKNDTFTIKKGTNGLLKPFVYTAKEPPQMGRITVTKQDAQTEEYLEGFAFRITAEKDITDLSGAVRKGTNAQGETVPLTAGTVVEEVTTGEDGKAISKELYLGEYTVQEIRTASGYSIGMEPVHVTLAADKDRASRGESAEGTAAFRNEPTVLEILKIDALTGDPLPGAVFRITGAEEEWEMTADETGRVRLEKLPSGAEYTVQEIKAPDGYNPEAQEQTFTIDENGLINGESSLELVFENVPNRVRISKQEITGGAEIPGATLTVRDTDGNVIEQWVSGTEPHTINALRAGDYTLTEELPAPGYATAETILFTVTDSLTVQTVVMKDDVTKVKITKSDITDGEPVIGAKLIIRNADGEEAASWTTGEDPYYIEKLPTGKYTLTEITAPDGYEVAETVEFEVKDTGEIQQVVMQDRPIPETEPETEPKTEPGTEPKTEPETETEPEIIPETELETTPEILPGEKTPPKKKSGKKTHRKTVKKQKSATAPPVRLYPLQIPVRTGDDTPVLLTLLMALLALGAVLIMLRRLKRR